jgi:hypothetical protein
MSWQLTGPSGEPLVPRDGISEDVRERQLERVIEGLERSQGVTVTGTLADAHDTLVEAFMDQLGRIGRWDR